MPPFTGLPGEPADQPTGVTARSEPAAGRPAPPPPPGGAVPSERRTIQIGARPGPLERVSAQDHPDPPGRQTWTPRLAAVVALAAFLLVVALLLLLAF